MSSVSASALQRRSLSDAASGGHADGMPRYPESALSREVKQLYRKVHLDITPETVPAFMESDLAEPLKPAASGGISAVYSFRARQADGTLFEGIWKPLDDESHGHVSEFSGIPKKNAQVAMRNLATVSFAEMLRFAVVPETRLAVFTDPSGGFWSGKKPMLGLAMARAPGVRAEEAPPEWFTDPRVMRELTKLQLLDHLDAEGDRHNHDVFIAWTVDGHVVVTGVDNDQCFGKLATDPEFIAKVRREGFHGTLMPPALDTDMAGALQASSHRDIRERLEARRFSGAEIRAAELRLDGLHRHIDKLDKARLVLAPADWDERAFSIFRQHPAASYVYRDHLFALERVRAGTR